MVLWRFFSASKKLATIRGKPVYIGSALPIGVAERGELDAKRGKLLEIEVKDASGAVYRLDTSDVKVRVFRDRVELDIAALPRYFEVKVRELNKVIDELKRAKGELDKSYRRLEDALLRGIISLEVYNDNIKRLREREDRLRSACADLERSVLAMQERLLQLRGELERRRERLEAKRILNRLESEEEEELGKVTDTLSSIDMLVQLMIGTLVQLKLIC
ncbi:MAG: hypothetical protein LM577_04250 [Thermoproteaceae archaeon]|nr:hypothetical protein [Thermoproteaceae archaeon]